MSVFPDPDLGWGPNAPLVLVPDRQAPHVVAHALLDATANDALADLARVAARKIVADITCGVVEVTDRNVANVLTSLAKIIDMETDDIEPEPPTPQVLSQARTLAAARRSRVKGILEKAVAQGVATAAEVIEVGYADIDTTGATITDQDASPITQETPQ